MPAQDLTTGVDLQESDQEHDGQAPFPIPLKIKLGDNEEGHDKHGYINNHGTNTNGNRSWCRRAASAEQVAVPLLAWAGHAESQQRSKKGSIKNKDCGGEPIAEVPDPSQSAE